MGRIVTGATATGTAFGSRSLGASGGKASRPREPPDIKSTPPARSGARIRTVMMRRRQFFHMMGPFSRPKTSPQRHEGHKGKENRCMKNEECKSKRTSLGFLVPLHHCVFT